MEKYVFELPGERRAPSVKARGTARVFTHKGEWLQGPIPVTINSEERYTIGVFSLLDDLNSAFVDVRKKVTADVRPSGTLAPTINIRPNGWNDGEVALVQRAVEETWREVGNGQPCSYDVYGYHDIRIGAGSGSSSALVQAAIRATAAEHVPRLPEHRLASVHGRVESGADPLNLPRPAIVATRLNLGRPVRPLGERTPNLWAVTWSAGSTVYTRDVRFEYNDEQLLLWRVRWASLERAVRYADDARVARLATESARESQSRNPNADIGLLEAAITKFGALGFAVAHTGSYHTALFAKNVDPKTLESYKGYVVKKSVNTDQQVEIFDTAQATERRFST